jgi:Protein of unknown function (DUF3168)
MSLATFGDIEGLVKTWLGFTAVAALVRRTDGGLNIFEAMPLSAPLPAVVLSRISGSADPRSDVAVDTARIQFDCWAATRTEAKTIAGTLAAEAVNLSERGGFTVGNDRLHVAEVVGWVWLPDRQSDTARYIVDASFTALTAP